MKPHITTQEIILAHAMEIAKTQGVDKLSIRKLATACGIAIGSVYNYFPNKDAVVTVMADQFWNGIFEDQERVYRSHMGFTAFVEAYYAFLYAKLSPYDSSWIREMDGKIPKGQVLELFRRALAEDMRANGAIWNMEFHPDNFCEYVFSNLMALLANGEVSPRFFIFLLENLLYRE